MFDKEKLAGPPSPEAAAMLLGLEVSALSADDAGEVVLACERLVRAVQAVQSAAVVGAVGPAKQPDHPHDTDGQPVDSDAEWLAVGLGGSRQFQLARIDDARFLRRWLPRTWAAMRAGIFGWYEAGLLVRAARTLTRPELIARLEERIVPRGAFDLARRLRRAVARLDPEAVEQKKKQARTGRRLQFFRDRWGDGTAGFSGAAESQLVALIAAAIDLDARPRAAGDCRTLDMRRFDVLADWARQRLGLPTEDNHPTPETAVHDPDGTATAARSAAAALLAHADLQPATEAQADSRSRAVAFADGQPGPVAFADSQCGPVASADSQPDPAFPHSQPGPVASADSRSGSVASIDSRRDPAFPGSQPGVGASAGGLSDSEALPDGQAGPLAPEDCQPELEPPGDRLLHRAKRCTACGRTGPPRLPINVTVSLDTLLRLSDQPAELAGWGLLDADTARDLAADGTWRRWLCDPTTGHLLDIGALDYRPRARLADFVRARDRTCRFPNCTQPAIRCDLDHNEPFDHDHPDHGGPTTRANVCSLCRHHHRLKHETDATYTTDPDGTTTWKDPSGRIHVRTAERHHHHDTDWTDWPSPDTGPTAEVSPPGEAGDATDDAEPECPF